MDFLQQLLTKAKASGKGRSLEAGGRHCVGQPLTSSLASADAADATAWRGGGRGADESLPPSVQYEFR